MQSSGAVAGVYARALSQLATDAQEERGWLDALRTLSAASQSPLWQEMMSAPGYSRTERARQLIALAGDLLSEKAALLIRTLSTFNRLKEVPAIERAFVRQMDLLHQRRDILVQTAHGLKDDEKAHLEKALTGHFDREGRLKLTLHYEVEASLLGGFVATCADRRLDASVRHQLDRLRSAMTTTTL